MPEQERLRPHRERVPGAARKDPAECRQQDSVVHFEPGPPNLAAKDRQLVPEHENLQLLRPITSGEEHHQLQQPAQHHVQS
jgi:hypothetical protein